MGNMTTLQILQGVHDWVLDKIDEETANFITKTVNDLVNYYTKSETYTKAEVQQIVDAIKQFTYEVVQVLPTASASTMNKIYLVPAPKSEDKNIKEEYITIQDGSTYSWEMLGTTSIDLSNYYTKGQTDSAISSALSNALARYTTTADLTTLLAQKQDVIQDLADIRSGASAGSTAVQPSTLNNAVKNVVAESGVYDVSANNDNTKFESLSALLSSANLNTLIPTDIRKGGMSIKFVLSSDNKYVCYMYKLEYANTTAGNTAFVNTANWEKIVLEKEFNILEQKVKKIENDLTDNIGEVSPKQIAKDLGYSKDANSIIFSSYDSRNNTYVEMVGAPFGVDLHNYDFVNVCKIKTNVYQAGTLTVGKIKKQNLQQEEPFDITNVFDKKVISVTTTGEQEISFMPICVAPDEYLIVCMPSDTIRFYYGTLGTDKTFYYASKYYNRWKKSDKSLNVDITAFEYVADSENLLFTTITKSDVLQKLIGVTVEDFVFNGWDSTLSDSTITKNAPYVLIKDFNNSLLRTVKLTAISPGTLSISKIKKIDAVAGAAWRGNAIYDIHTLDVDLIGIQVINVEHLNISIHSDEYLCVSLTTDTLIWKFGSTTQVDTEKGFLYKVGNYWASSSSAIGVSITASNIERSSYSGKKISILGDSISTFSGWIPSGNATYYPSGTVQNVHDTWWMKLIYALGFVLDTNNSWSGSRVTTTNGETSAGCMSRCQNLGTPDVIIVWMGINDFNSEVPIGTYDGMSSVPSTTDTFREAYGIMLDKILTTYKTSEVWVCTLPQCERNASTGFPEVNADGLCLEQYNKAIRELAFAFGVRVLEHALCGLTYQNMSVYNPDELHPNKDGHSLIANNDIRQLDNAVRIRY